MDKRYSHLFAVPNGVIDWLERITENVAPLNPLDIFKTYKPLDRGNKKLAKNILSFSLPSISTCGMYCKGCYDIRSMRYISARKKRYVNYSMAIHNPEKLADMIVKQILSSRTCEFVRIHVGGDFFSLKYVNMWGKIIARVQAKKPEIEFYTYTKSIFTNKLKGFGINVVKSLYGKDQFNYGSFEDMKVLAKKEKAFICPVTVMNAVGKKVPDQYCGSACTACMVKEKVLFVQH